MGYFQRDLGLAKLGNYWLRCLLLRLLDLRYPCASDNENR